MVRFGGKISEFGKIKIEWYKGDCYVIFALLGHDFVGKNKVYYSGLKFL